MTARLVGIAALAVMFVALTIAVSAGAFSTLDIQVATATHSIWNESLHGAFQAVAELGGFELTSVLMIGFAVYLWRAGFGSDVLAVVSYLGAGALEFLYKHLLYHPGPPATIAHTDGPSVTTAIDQAAGLGNSFPSGHVVRSVLVYGLLAFAVRRLAGSPLARALAAPAAIVIIVVMAFDRLYLDVHWESDVIGGLLLGAIALLAATVWLDRLRKVDN